MPPTPNRQQRGDTRGRQYIDIDDFTPGLYNASPIAAASPAFTPGPFPAPVGAADASQTYQCLALPGGGIGPGPGLVASFSLSDLGITDPPSTGYIAGWVMTDLVLNDEIVVTIEYQSGGNNHVRVWESTFQSPSSNLLFTLVQATPAGGGVSGSPYPFATRVAASNPTTTIGNIVIAIPISDSGDIILYPDPAAPGSIGIHDFMSTIANILFGHQNRICCLQAVTLTWPITAVANGNTDAINYTDPPNSETFPGTSPSTVFVAEEPFGYGAVGSMNAGELFMVKNRGGGVVVQGDINNPTVTYLPGVKSTGPIYGHGDSDGIGFYYCVDMGGAYVWSGGSGSSKISQQLDDNFFVPANVVPSRFFNYFCKRWGRWMLFSNNWMYDSILGSWWRLLNPATASLFGYDEAFVPSQLYANINQVAGTGTKCFYKFDDEVPTSSWQWQNLPIRVSEDRFVDVREVLIRYSNPYGGTGTFSFVVSAIDAGGNVQSAATFTYLSAVARPTMQRLNLRAQAEDVTIRIVATANTAGQPAPAIHSISVGYDTRQHAGSTL